jgi:hypothetical protein
VAFTVSLVFTLGMSLSFLISGLLVRSRKAGVLVVLAAVLTVITLNLLGLVDLIQLLHPLFFYRNENPIWIGATFLEIIVLSVMAVFAMKERISLSSRRYSSRLLPVSRKFWGTERNRVLLAKEWLELKRSGTLGPVVIGFVGPLLAVYGMVFLFTRGLEMDIEFNVIFYSALIGFFGVMTYSFLTLVEPNDTFDILPVKVSDLIRIKLKLYFIFTSVISTIYIIVIGLIDGNLLLIPIGIYVGASTNVYVAYVTARLTGLRTNSMLLDAVTLQKFSLFVVPPLILMVITSFFVEEMDYGAPMVLICLSTLLICAAIILKSGIEKRWGRERFGF